MAYQPWRDLPLDEYRAFKIAQAAVLGPGRTPEPTDPRVTPAWRAAKRAVLEQPPPEPEPKPPSLDAFGVAQREMLGGVLPGEELPQPPPGAVQGPGELAPQAFPREAPFFTIPEEQRRGALARLPAALPLGGLGTMLSSEFAAAGIRDVAGGRLSLGEARMQQQAEEAESAEWQAALGAASILPLPVGAAAGALARPAGRALAPLERRIGPQLRRLATEELGAIGPRRPKLGPQINMLGEQVAQPQLMEQVPGGQKVPLADTEALAARQARGAALAQGQAELPEAPPPSPKPSLPEPIGEVPTAPTVDQGFLREIDREVARLDRQIATGKGRGEATRGLMDQRHAMIETRQNYLDSVTPESIKQGIDDDVIAITEAAGRAAAERAAAQEHPAYRYRRYVVDRKGGPTIQEKQLAQAAGRRSLDEVAQDLGYAQGGGGSPSLADVPGMATAEANVVDQFRADLLTIRETMRNKGRSATRQVISEAEERLRKANDGDFSVYAGKTLEQAPSGTRPPGLLTASLPEQGIIPKEAPAPTGLGPRGGPPDIPPPPSAGGPLTDPILSLPRHREIVAAAEDLFTRGGVQRNPNQLISDQILEFILQERMPLPEMQQVLQQHGLGFSELGDESATPDVRRPLPPRLGP